MAACAVSDSALRCLDLRHGIDRHDDRPFQPLGGMHGVECYRFFLSVGAAFDCPGFVGPCSAHRFGESAQASYRIRATEAEKKVDIGERPLGLVAMALKENRPHAQHINCLRQQFVWRSGVDPAPQRLELLNNISGVGV